ncbi:hypothetical protein OEA41_007700 [Lepraria neglecta]|uniref:Uncharacterized protein n=1 Tax=Lepraria neglecta TaxID=209136 RepID=A0AAD9ZD99_9LECA|nr:hypothetical protein OEA41_007700 [Lepraria neglecta]
MSDTKIGVLDFARSDYDSNNVTIELVSRSKLKPYGLIFQKVPIPQSHSRFFLFYKSSEYGCIPNEPYYKAITY